MENNYENGMDQSVVEAAFAEPEAEAVVETTATPVEEVNPVEEFKIVNKAGIQPVPCDRYVITSSQVVKYLQDQLGFTIGYDFTRWVGVSPDHSYVRMRVVFNPKDIMADSKHQDYVDRLLESKGAGMQFKDTVMETLKPFMFPDNIGLVQASQEDIDRMYALGIITERYEEIAKFTKLSYCAQANLFRLYLRPERIICDMLANPKTDKVDGNLSIIAVAGTSSDTIRWEVAVERKNTTFAAKTDLSMDQIFYKH